MVFIEQSPIISHPNLNGIIRQSKFTITYIHPILGLETGLGGSYENLDLKIFVIHVSVQSLPVNPCFKRPYPQFKIHVIIRDYPFFYSQGSIL